MAFDGLTVCRLADELNKKLFEGRIEKVLQPEKDEVNLVIRAKGENHRLLISAGSFAPRAHLTSSVKENPAVPPLFCMLLRKHIAGGRVVSFEQPDFERILIMRVASRDELGDMSIKSLYMELMGRCSNIVLVDAGGKILGCAKNIDISVSSVRQVLTGLTYTLPPSQNKINPLLAIREEIFNAVDKVLPADKAVLEGFTGISPLIAREIAYTFFGDATQDLSMIDYTRKSAFAEHIYSWFRSFTEDNDGGWILTDTHKRKTADFAPVDICQYGDYMEKEHYDSISNVIDTYYYQKDLTERANQRKSNLTKFVNNNIARCQKKLAVLQRELSQAQGKEKYKICGDILTANLYQLKEGQKSVVLFNYYDNNDISIDLLQELSPSANAQRYYNLYNKYKTAEIRCEEQLGLCQGELEYFESVLSLLEINDTEKELMEIRDELVSAGYMVGNKSKGKKQPKKAESKPLHFTTSEGLDVYVGKNNLQNDKLTMKTAHNSDIWFHVKNYPGSHTILAAAGREYTDASIMEAAVIAARHSKASSSSKVPVDYTFIRNIKKPNGAKPGFVIYETYNTVYVTP
ncbi:MAG: NFACT RNA binding domain-containing protein [Eubacteriales bacterium]|nr:NFACT RNA binding domain-containing protein [Eubacteriales bacterium]